MLYEGLQHKESLNESVGGMQRNHILIVSREDFAVHGMVSLLDSNESKYTVSVIEPDDFTVSAINSSCPNIVLVNANTGLSIIEMMIRGINDLSADTCLLLFGYGMDEDFLYKAMSLGVRGYLNEKMRGDHLISAVDTVAKGGYWAERHILSQFISEKSVHDKIEENISDLCTLLTTRESEVLELILEGLTTNEIADKIYLSHQGVKAHLTNLFRKFEVKNRAQLILKTLDHISPVNKLSEIAGKGLRSARSQSK